MSDKKYTEEELYQLLFEKAEEIEKVPGVREINSDPRLPNYEVFKECFGNFRKSEKLNDLVQEFSLLNKMNGCYCLDVFCKLKFPVFAKFFRSPPIGKN
jgi:hypothetical protein